MTAKTELTKEQLKQAAALRDEGTTWNAIREAFGVKLGSSAWFKLWRDNEIPHRAAGERTKQAAPEPAPAVTDKTPARRTAKPKPAIAKEA